MSVCLPYSVFVWLKKQHSSVVAQNAGVADAMLREIKVLVCDFLLVKDREPILLDGEVLAERNHQCDVGGEIYEFIKGVGLEYPLEALERFVSVFIDRVCGGIVFGADIDCLVNPVVGGKKVCFDEGRVRDVAAGNLEIGLVAEIRRFLKLSSHLDDVGVVREFELRLQKMICDILRSRELEVAIVREVYIANKLVLCSAIYEVDYQHARDAFDEKVREGVDHTDLVLELGGDGYVSGLQKWRRGLVKSIGAMRLEEAKYANRKGHGRCVLQSALDPVPTSKLGVDVYGFVCNFHQVFPTTTVEVGSVLSSDAALSVVKFISNLEYKSFKSKVPDDVIARSDFESCANYLRDFGFFYSLVFLSSTQLRLLYLVLEQSCVDVDSRNFLGALIDFHLAQQLVASMLVGSDKSAEVKDVGGDGLLSTKCSSCFVSLLTSLPRKLGCIAGM